MFSILWSVIRILLSMDEDNSMSSDSDDEDYAPEESSDDEYANDEVNESKRKRKTRTFDDELHHTQNSDTNTTSNTEEQEPAKEEDSEKKARIDKLWDGFKKDVGDPKVSKNAAVVTRPSEAHTSSTQQDTTTAQSKTITIKKTFDFAGEDVVVEESVDVESKEAKEYTKSLPSPQVNVQARGSKKVLGAKALLQSLNKKPKISTLDKSKLDWDKYKANEGIEEELQFQKKDGYLEKKEFLARTDERQFEQEKEERMKRFKKWC